MNVTPRNKNSGSASEPVDMRLGKWEQSDQSAFQAVHSRRRLSRQQVQLDRFVLGLTGAIAASLTWQQPIPALASYGGYSPAESSATFESINIFGDSLVDAGNLFELTSEFSSAGVPALPPSPPYAQKFSNGDLWVEKLAGALNLSPALRVDLATDPGIAAPDEGINFAFAGALSSDRNLIGEDLPDLASNLPGLQEQIDEFSAISSALPNISKSLNIIWAGSNDYIAAIANPELLEGASLAQLPDVVTDNIIGGLAQLSSVGAKDFLVVNLPPLGDTPFADFLNAQSEADIPSALNQVAVAHNAQLSQKLNEFGYNNPDTNIIPLDVNTLFTSVVNSPDKFGLTNTTEPCLTNFQPGFQFEGICENPDQFLFWDDVHPTAATHQIIGSFAIATLQKDKHADIPEHRSSLPLLLVGAVSAGILVKRRWKEATR